PACGQGCLARAGCQTPNRVAASTKQRHLSLQPPGGASSERVRGSRGIGRVLIRQERPCLAHSLPSASCGTLYDREVENRRMASVARPRGPKGLPILGCLVDLRRRPLDLMLETARYGDVAYLRLPFVGGAYLLNHPDHIGSVLVDNAKAFVKSADYAVLKQLLGEGLVTSEGELHKRQRRLIAPAFHRGRINTYADIMTGYGLKMCERWQPGAALDIHREMTQVTLAIVSKTLLDADVDSAGASAVSDAVTMLMPLIDNPILMISPKLFRWMPGHRSYRRALELLDSTVYRIVAEHRRIGDDRGDLLSMLLAARDEEDAGRRMSDQQVRDEVMTIFLAGHETTANALTWTFYL